VRIESRLGEGTSVHIFLPGAEAQLRVPDVGSLVAKAKRALGGELILPVDDDNAVREVTAQMLRDLGYDVIEAGSGGAALDLLEREPKLDLILIDFAMPGMNGAEVARQVQAKRPTLPILFVTGFADRSALAGVSESHIIGKPFVAHELADKVRGALAGRAARNVIRLRR
jgi:CheY-like chemotaxis protein